LYNLLSPYFKATIMVQTTAQLRQILNNNTLQGEVVQNAVVINTFGEAVPISTEYCTTPYSNNNYAYYCYFLGQKVRIYNWTWASIVGYPFYYVSNTRNFTNNQNGWGIYGMIQVGQAGINAFLQGLDNKTPYNNDPSKIAESVGVVNLSSQISYYCNYYGIYPSPYQTSTRALKDSIRNAYNLKIGLRIFDNVTKDGVVYNPGTLYQHIFRNDVNITGSLLALGLARTPDIRLTAVSLLSYYKPRLYRSEYNATGTSRLVILQLGQMGGI